MGKIQRLASQYNISEKEAGIAGIIRAGAVFGIDPAAGLIRLITSACLSGCRVNRHLFTRQSGG